MPPISLSLDGWEKRDSQDEAPKELLRRYFFLCEGQNTEKRYFDCLKHYRKELGIRPNIIVDCFNKTEEDVTQSDPKRLIEKAQAYKTENDIDFDPELDKIIIVFDADVFEKRRDDFYEIIQMGEDNGDILGVTNPSFELFLLLHYENSVKEIILPDEEKIIENNWFGSNRYIVYAFTTRSGMNPKTNRFVGRLVLDVRTAIEQEKMLNNDIHCCKGKLTSNIGKIIEMIIDNKETI
jgi:hypothetical protein